VLSALLVVAVTASPAESLGLAQQAFDALEFDKVVTLAPVPAQWRSFTRAQVVQALSLRALALASIKRDDEAKQAFRQLLSVQPDFQLPEQFGPRVRTLQLEAKDEAERSGRLTIAIEGRTVLVNGTAFGLAEQVRMEWSGGQTSLPIAPRCEAAWPKDVDVGVWVTVLGPGQSVLASLGTSEAPYQIVAAPVSAPVVVQAPVRRDSTLTVVGIITGAVGLAAVGGGVYALTLASRPDQALAQAMRDAEGRVTSLTQRQAFGLDAQANTAWQAAGALLIVGGLAVAAGVTMFVVDAVSVSATPSSVSLAVPLDALFSPHAGAAR